MAHCKPGPLWKHKLISPKWALGARRDCKALTSDLSGLRSLPQSSPSSFRIPFPQGELQTPPPHPQTFAPLQRVPAYLEKILLLRKSLPPPQRIPTSSSSALLFRVAAPRITPSSSEWILHRADPPQSSSSELLLRLPRGSRHLLPLLGWASERTGGWSETQEVFPEKPREHQDSHEAADWG